MIETKVIRTEDDFKSLKKGDVVACQFHRDVFDYPKKTPFKFKVFEIFEVKHNTNEIVLQGKNNIYFNYDLFLNSWEGDSNLRCCVLLNCN